MLPELKPVNMDSIEKHYIQQLTMLSPKNAYKWACDEIDSLAFQLTDTEADSLEEQVNESKSKIDKILSGNLSVVQKAKIVRDEIKIINNWVRMLGDEW